METTSGLFTWLDTLKVIVGFISSAGLIWLGIVLQDFIQKRKLKRSVWNVLKHQTTLKQWIEALDEMSESAKKGNGYAISFDISNALSQLICNIAELDPLKSDIYYDFLGKEEVARKGLAKINLLQMELARSRSDDKENWPNENTSIRNTIQGQCSALKKDIIGMYESQLELMKYIEIKRKDSLDPIKQLQKDLNEYRVD